jgi:sucrose-6-phosphate hydrolase SacC (GH32 family)
LSFNIRGAHINLTSKTIAIEPGTRSTSVPDQIKTVEILVDRASIEAFVNGGELSSTTFVLPQENGLSVKAEGGSVTIQSLTVYPLDSAWKDGVGN